MPTRNRPPLYKATSQAHLAPSKAAPVTPPAQSSTACLLQRLKALQHETLPEPSESAPDDILNWIDMTDTENDSPPRTAPVPMPRRPLVKFTTTDNTLGLDVGSNPGYPPILLTTLKTVPQGTNGALSVGDFCTSLILPECVLNSFCSLTYPSLNV
jgi:hypothetical protein